MTLAVQFTVPGEVEQSVPLSQPTMVVGKLLSNHLILKADGVEPIHALIEQDENENWLLTDLGSEQGIRVNGKSVEVECAINAGDLIEIGSVALRVVAYQSMTAPPPPPPGAIPEPPGTVDTGSFEIQHSLLTNVDDQVSGATLARPTQVQAPEQKSRRRDVLFSPRKARPGGDVLEVVAYWGDTVLEVDHFEDGKANFDRVTIGDPTKTHFIAAGKNSPANYTLATVSSSGYKVSLRDGMSARFRRGGKVEKKEGAGSVALGKRDIAHITYGPVRYFLLFVRPPALNLPARRMKDPIFTTMMSVALFLYILTVPTLWLSEPPDKKDLKDDLWSIVHIPEKEVPKPKVVEKKPKVDLAKTKVEPPKKPVPPPPKPKPFKPAPPKEVEKVTQPKPTPKPVEKPKVNVAEAPKPTPTPPAPQVAPRPTGRGMPSTGAKSPDNKLAGPQNNKPLGRAGGAKGSGMRQRGGARKGTSTASHKGVEGVKNNKSSGVNLEKLGLGAGKILSKTGPGAVRTNLRNSAGGAGGGAGSADKTYGLGGVGQAKSIGLAGAGSSVNAFGSGSDGMLGGQGGTGGQGGIGNAFGGGRRPARVSLPAGDPLVNGGLTSQEVMSVIRANLNQIRHCYEQLLQRSPTATGTVKVRFLIAANGRVSSANISSSTIRDSTMQNCVVGKIRRWKFPNPRGGQAVTVDFPFSFTPL